MLQKNGYGFLGQGATEYLVLLAVVLIVALVSIALLQSFPSMATDARITQSQSYWRGARPFAILDHSITVAGAGRFVLQNTEASGTYTITSITVGGCTNSTSTSFAPGEVKTITASGCNATGAASGAIYDFGVNITYTSPSGITGMRQYGTRNIVGKYT